LPVNSGKPENIATMVTEVSDRVTVLIREEIELAKAEMTLKARKLAVGAGVGVAAGIFGVFAFIYFLSTVAWGLNSVLGSVWQGFLVVLIFLIVFSIAAGTIAYRLLRVGPPVPKLAIGEAQKIRDTVAGPQTPTPIAPRDADIDAQIHQAVTSRPGQDS
jgi:hypothetical protein